MSDNLLTARYDANSKQSADIKVRESEVSDSGGGGGGSGVSSVNGRTGAVTLAKADVGLANVDNTSDVNKPVSTAQAAADSAVASGAAADATTKANTAQTNAIAAASTDATTKANAAQAFAIQRANHTDSAWIKSSSVVNIND